MNAILAKKLNDERVVVHATTEHPCSSYGQPVWVDNNNEAYTQVGLPSPLYDIIPVNTLDRLADYLNDYFDSHNNDWPEIHELIEVNGWEDESDEALWKVCNDGEHKVILNDDGRAIVCEV